VEKCTFGGILLPVCFEGIERLGDVIQVVLGRPGSGQGTSMGVWA